jgi:hypothetical protein
MSSETKKKREVDVRRAKEKLGWLLGGLLALAPIVRADSPAASPSPEPDPTQRPPATGAVPAPAPTPKPEEEKPRLDIYGFAMLDMGYETRQSDPAWFDVMRPSKLPAFTNQFGVDGHYYAGVRQSRFGVKGYLPTDLGEIKTIFEFELFGTGVDAGQTTFRLRHAWGELNDWGAGQTWSPFMDIDVFPNSVEYWGPNGMVFFRNVQLRWMPLHGELSVQVALERPGASADQGDYAGRVELQNVKPKFPLPDLSAHVRREFKWGHVQFAGIVRRMQWVDTHPTTTNLSGKATGWGLHLSTNVKIKKDTIRAAIVGGDGIENYMNDAPVDIGVRQNPGNTVQPIIGVALPILGLSVFYDRTWNDHFTSTAGYSGVNISNTNGQSASAFKLGEYILANVLYHPVPDVLLGPEIIYGRRENYYDGFKVDDIRYQFSVKYNFKGSLGGK